ISRLQTVAAEAREHWEAFRQDRAFEAIREFVTEDLSRFYIQVVRERMWAETDDPEKRAAYETITYALHRVVALLAPFTPLLADEIYDRLTGDAGHPTVHMLDYPAPEERFRDQQLERDVELLRAVEEGGSNARQQAERKLRWPVREVVVAPDGERTAAAVDRHRGLIADRLNARRVEVLAPDEEWGELRYSADADMSELGPAFGGRATAVMEALNEARVEDPSLAALEEHLRGEGALDADEELTESMVSLTSETPEGVSGAAIEADGETLGVVYVDTALTEEIESEGYAREVIRRIQEMRKELDLDIERRIQVEVTVDDDRVAELIGGHEELIAREVRARSFETVEGGYHREWEIEGVPVEIGVEPAPEAAA
ncbi:isoleucine--tRNA ligase, partial [Halobacteriales archaeon QH_10_67_13]